MKKILSLFLSVCLLVSLGAFRVPEAGAVQPVPDLSGLIANRQRRQFVTAMLRFHLAENGKVQEALTSGCSALFLFDGCSDNMDDPELSDLSYYRVSGVCIVIRLDQNGTPYVAYFSDVCSTLPDRPLDYGQWYLESAGIVGPATVRDGTYELYSVYHAGAYEALHLRTDYADATVDAVYMTPEGYTGSRATYINIHTRTGNHILEKAAWSSGCMLVGDGEFSEFEQLIDVTCDANYDIFMPDQWVGTVTINRLLLRDELRLLYQDPEAVEAILSSSLFESPEIYLERCIERETYGAARLGKTRQTVEAMTLPCGGNTDSRSISAGNIPRAEKLDVHGAVINTEGERWYMVERFGEIAYVPAESVELIRRSWIDRVIDAVFD